MTYQQLEKLCMWDLERLVDELVAELEEKRKQGAKILDQMEVEYQCSMQEKGYWEQNDRLIDEFNCCREEGIQCLDKLSNIETEINQRMGWI
jgi:hypothetical protein